MDFPDTIQEKRGITQFPSFICLKWYFCLFDLKIDFLTLKMTLGHKNNTRKGLLSQNHMQMRYYTCSWLHFLEKHIYVCLRKIPPKSSKVAPGWFLFSTSFRTRINHKTSCIPQNMLELKNGIWQVGFMHSNEFHQPLHCYVFLKPESGLNGGHFVFAWMFLAIEKNTSTLNMITIIS